MIELVRDHALLWTVAAASVLLHELVRLIAARRAWQRTGMGMIDEATGLSNPREAWEFDCLAALAREQDRTLSVIVVRVPLREAVGYGRWLHARMRRSDVAIRWDADEFVIGVVTDTPQQAQLAADRLFDPTLADVARIGIACWSRDSLLHTIGAATHGMRSAVSHTPRTQKTGAALLLSAGAVLAAAFVLAGAATAMGGGAFVNVAALGALTCILAVAARAYSLRRSTLIQAAAACCAVALVMLGLHMDSPTIAAIGVLILAIEAGAALGCVLDRVAWLAPVACIAAMSDIRSFTSGTTKHLLDGMGASTASHGAAQGTAPVTLDLSLLMMPVRLPVDTWVVGSIDAALIVALVVATERLHLSMRATIVAVVAAVAAAAAIGPPLPLLPFIMGAFVLAHAPTILAASRYALARIARPVAFLAD